MRPSSWSRVCRLRRGILVCRVCLDDQSIVGTCIVSLQLAWNRRCTHHTPGFLVVMYIYLLVQRVEVVFLSPQLCVLVLVEGVLRNELPSS